MAGKKKGPSSGLPFCPQPTPEWQKGIQNFFTIIPRKASTKDDENTENDKENVESDVMEVDGETENKSKGKGPAKGKKR